MLKVHIYKIKTIWSRTTLIQLIYQLFFFYYIINNISIHYKEMYVRNLHRSSKYKNW